MKSKQFIRFQNKYKNVRQTIDGINFDSKKEADYYLQLKIEKKARLIKDFERQVSFELRGWTANAQKEVGIAVCRHIVDFYVTLKDGTKEVREVKSYGTMTDVWKLKHKLFEANYPDIPYRIIL